jgi:predicted transglutaminase-like cysteine proteinase
MPAWRGAQTSTAHGLQNPRSVCATVKRHVRYSRDTSPEEEWKDAEDTWSEGTGDCEDFAVLVKQRCRQRGVTAEVYSFYPPKGSGHAVVIGEWKGRLWMSSNGSFVEISSIEDASCRVAQSQGWDPDLVLMKVGEKSRHTAASW